MANPPVKEPPEIPPPTPGRPTAPPVESPPGNPQPEVPPPIDDPAQPPQPQELPGRPPDEIPMRGRQGPHTRYPIHDPGIVDRPGLEPDVIPCQPIPSVTMSLFIVET